MIRPSEDNEYYELKSPTIMPKASGFLWNEKMMIHMNCRGYAVAQFMQPEPSKYSHAPNLEAKSFMQPEQPYYAHHPGRFVYVKDEVSDEIFSVPYEPVRGIADDYTFYIGKNNIKWQILKNGLHLEMCLSLPKDEPLEMWCIKVKNVSQVKKKMSIYPYFSIGYMSWMNQSGAYDKDLKSIICTSITPYQKYQEYDKIKNLSDKTFLISEQEPFAWEVNGELFEGEGGLASPDGVCSESLSKGDARYEMPVAVLQYKLELEPGEERVYRLLFGPAQTDEDIRKIRKKHFNLGNGEDGFHLAELAYEAYIKEGKGCIEIKTPDQGLDNFVNHWLPRQMYYHGKTNRLSTDPQTRNYLQDNMGMSYIQPKLARDAFLFALSQQDEKGSMPDGILLLKDAELKYINQVPHSDHCVWLPICLSAYLDETNDYELLQERVPFAGGNKDATVFEHITLAMNWLIKDRDHRGLNYINQGDWCDPMNMVGYKGKGVSGWLTIASAYAFIIWADICKKNGQFDHSLEFQKAAEQTNASINNYLWQGDWYARGITDDNVVFGVSKDPEGRIYLNPQGWALLSGAADAMKQMKIIEAVTEQLESPYGVEMLAPAYTAMREDVGRLTQKHPGTAENGAVYNHAAAFYIYSLYAVGEGNHAFDLLRKMIPGPDLDDLIQRGQLPVFIPNYYRGAYRQIPRTAGRSSHLFNTGTVQWIYRCLIDGLFGLKGCREGLEIKPQLPSTWNEASVKRSFRGAEINVEMIRDALVHNIEVYLEGERIEGGILKDIQPGETYKVLVKIPK